MENTWRNEYPVQAV